MGQENTVKEVNPQKLLYLGRAGEWLANMSALTGRSQSDIMRKILANEKDKVPEHFRPKGPVVEQLKSKKRSDHFYIGEELREALDNFKRNTGKDKSTLVVALIRRAIQECPTDFEYRPE